MNSKQSSFQLGKVAARYNEALVFESVFCPMSLVEEMLKSELLIVEDRFTIEQVGLLVLPDFSVPDNDWKPSKEDVAIQRPDGVTLEAVAEFNHSHFNIPDPKVPID